MKVCECGTAFIRIYTEYSNQISTSKQSRGREMEGLGAGILNIISSTSGELPPSQLRNFLNQVRGKKKIAEIAGYFTSNIPALVNQLHKVEANYYKQGRKGCRMDKDVDFIRKVRMRLQKDDTGDLCTNNFEEHHSNVYQSLFSSGGKTEVFASTSSCKQTSARPLMKQSSEREMPSLSSGIFNIISTISGELPPLQMRNFLNQVRGRKKAVEIASHFTSNIPGLVSQLQEVEVIYYRQGRNGPKMDRDIDFIRRLRTRLHSESSTAVVVSNNNFISQEYHNKDVYQSLFLEDGRTEETFASISSCKQTLALPPAKKKTNAPGTGTFSSGTIKIVLNTSGVLDPLELCNFLNQVRGKKKALEIARRFTSNIPALVNQLQNVEANYYKHGRKGVKMDKDIDFIRRLINRL